MNDTMAETVALDAVDQAIYRYSQPVGFGSKSLMENRGNALTKMVMLFMSDPRLKTGIVLDAVEGLRTGKGDRGDHIRRIAGVMLLSLGFHAASSAYRDAFTDDTDEEIWGWEGWVRALILAPFSGFFVVGAAIDSVVTPALGMKWFSGQNPIPIYGAIDRGKRAVKNRDDIFNYMEPEEMLKEWENIARSVAVAGVPSAVPATFLNAIRPIFGMAANIEEEE
jgi:hypothetical protein